MSKQPINRPELLLRRIFCEDGEEQKITTTSTQRQKQEDRKQDAAAADTAMYAGKWGKGTGVVVLRIYASLSSSSNNSSSGC